MLIDRSYIQVIAAVVIGTVVVIIGSVFGLWWATMLVGLAIGLLPPGGRVTYAAAGLAGVLGWGLPLAWQALSVSIGAVASAVGGIVGLGANNGALVIVLALVLALLLSLSAAWVGASVRRLILPPPDVDTENLPDIAAPEPVPLRTAPRAAPKRRRRR